ncbi:MAG: cyanoexosortase A system-associated protein [Lyngbya sp.]|nr:cyanoexosortase A system-associated protein [Lyngbya sp.]
MKLWQPLRTSLLILTFGTVVLVWGKSVVSPAPKELTKTPFDFPNQVPISGWKAIKTQNLEAEIPGKIYEYASANLKLEIEMEYVDHPHVNEKKFRQYDPRLSGSEGEETGFKKQEKTGYYRLGITENRAYLRSCINPRGPGVITYEQFIQNRYTYDLQPSRLLPILSGQEPIRDHRCLWTYVSIPLENLSEQQAYSILEKVWLSWYQWWHPRFPEI